MRARTFPFLGIPLVLFAAFGCTSSHDGVEKHLASLRDDITRLQTDNDRLLERVDALEARQTRPTPTPVPAAPPGEKTSTRSPLKVVKLFPGDAPPVTDDPTAPQELAADERPDAPGTRPVIRLRGKSEDESRRSARKSSPEESP
jgi:hypothetical protein